MLCSGQRYGLFCSTGFGCYPKEQIGSRQERRDDEPNSHKGPPTPLDRRHSLRPNGCHRGSRSYPIHPPVCGRHSLQAHHIPLRAWTVITTTCSYTPTLTQHTLSETPQLYGSAGLATGQITHPSIAQHLCNYLPGPPCPNAPKHPAIREEAA